MRARGLTQFLFFIALAVQVVAPAADAASRFAGSFVDCSVSTEVHEKESGAASAPAAPRHGAVDCQHCPTMAGGVPLPELPHVVAVPTTIPIARMRVAETRTVFSFPILNDGAPPRAPPSRG